MKEFLCSDTIEETPELSAFSSENKENSKKEFFIALWYKIEPAERSIHGQKAEENIK